MRMTKADYKIPDTHLTLPKGTWLIVPTYSIHRDADYFPNPDTFDPDRFLATAEARRTPFTYLPFGEGPRVCLGDRFGLQEVRLTLIALLTKFHFKLNGKTDVPIQLLPQVFAVMAPKSGVWMKVTAVRDSYEYKTDLS